MPYTIDQYTTVRTLGSGISAKVKLATGPNGKTVAIKVFDKKNPHNDAKMLSSLQKEVETLLKLKHSNIVQCLEFQADGFKVKADGRKIPIAYIVMELVEGGELFDYVAIKPFKPEICRFYFNQMLQALHYSHSSGVAHRDLKPENILLDKNFNAKIADFGFAAPVEGRDGSGFLHTVLGTQSYMAPEITSRQPYQGPVVDLFALGIILFILYSGHPPFAMAEARDPHYKLLATNRADLFWKTHSGRKPEGFFTDSFKDLITNMLQLQSHQRLSMADIIGHRWMSEQMATHQDVRSVFTERANIIKAQQKAEQEAKAALKNTHTNKKLQGVRRGEDIGGKVFMSGPLTEEESKDQTIVNIQLAPFKHGGVNKNTLFFSTYEPEHVFKQLISKLEDKDLTPETCLKKWRLTYTKVREQDDEEKAAALPERSCKVEVRLMQVDKEKICVEFNRQAGDAWYFYEQFQMMKDALSDINDATFD